LSSCSERPRTAALRAFNPAVLEDADANPAALVIVLRWFKGSSAERPLWGRRRLHLPQPRDPPPPR
jgi:hypothetical protein